MNNSIEYLPIGTICNIKTNNKPVMIIGYYSIEYSGSIKMYDYKGCDYPEGLLKNSIISFNKTDIIEVLYNGYINDDFNKFNSIITEQKVNTNVKENDKQIFSNIKFDENGVVVYTELNSEKNNVTIKNEIDTPKQNNFVNPFYKQYSSDNDSTIQDSNEWPIFKNIVFDENGTVVQIEEYTSEEKSMKNEE